MKRISINLSRESSYIKAQFYPPNQLDSNKRHEMVLIRRETYISIPNIDKSNSVMRYEIDGEIHDIIIPTGAYKLKQMNDVIHSKLVKPGVFDLLANSSTLKSIIRIDQPGVKVHFDHEASIRDMLGFNSKTLQGVDDH